MEDQGKRLLLAVAVAFAVVLVWNQVSERLFPQPKPPPGEKSPESQQPGTDATQPPDQASGPELASSTGTPRPPGHSTGEPTGESTGEKGPATSEGTSVTPAPARPRQDEQFIELQFAKFMVRFSSYGGTLHSWQLVGSKYHEIRDGKDVPIDIVRAGRSEEVLPFAVSFAGRDWWPAHTEWQGRKKSDTEVEYAWSLMSQESGSETAVFDIVKTYRILPDDYLLELTLEVRNRQAREENQTVVISLFSFQDTAAKTSSWGTQVDTAWKSECFINDSVSATPVQDLLESPKKRFGSVAWGGFNHSYFLFAVAPNGDSGKRMGCNSYAYEKQPGLMRTDLVFPEANLVRGGPPATYVVTAYLGPKYLDKLESIPAKIGFDPHFDDAVDLGWFGVIAGPLMWLLQWFHSFMGNWGLAIIALTIVVKLATLYWNTKSIRSMRKMASLKPQMEVIQKKFPDDKARQQQEIMNLYKAHGVNPVAGCLPMFLQMPIWIALYRTLGAAAELYHSPFIPGWIDDLTATDPYYVLPIALMGMMFLQAKLSPSTPDSTQQKIMMYGLPLMFGVFGFFFPAGLTLYMFTNAVLTALHNVWMNRTDPTLKQSKGDSKPGAGSDGAVSATSSAGSSARTSGKESAREAAGDDTGKDGERSDAAERPEARKNGGRKQRRRGGKRKRGGNGS